MDNYSTKFDKLCRIVYDATDVFSMRLRTGDIDGTVISKCIKDVLRTRKEDIKILKDIVEDADQREPHWFEEVDQDTWDDSVTAKKDMFGPLDRIFSTIVDFQPNTKNPSLPKRVFRFASNELVDDVSITPDIQVVQYGASEGDSSAWNDRHCFGEVEPSNRQGPKTDDDTDVPTIAFQAAEYARQHLTYRPLLLFCTGLLIFGTKFCVGIYDREGVVFSTIHDIFDEIDIFVRVVRSLAHVLSIQELGLDPTVRLLTNEETVALTGRPQEVPSAIIPLCRTGQSTTYWCTIGQPTWTSSSLLGRGTVFWTVKRCHRRRSTKKCAPEDDETSIDEWLLDNHVTMLLKSSWRSILLQTTESDMYQYLPTVLPDCATLARFELGGDVHFPQGSTKPITVRNLRNYPNCSDLISHSEPTLILHRIVLSTVGDHIWEYDSELEFLRGFRDALLTHKSLTERGLIHRDINPGNILLVHKNNQTENKEARDIVLVGAEHSLSTAPFITRTDVRDQRSGETRTRTHINVEGHSAVGRGASMGDTQFMALELLMSLVSGREVQHEVHHDIESFVWSMLYCIMRHIAEERNKSHRPEITRSEWEEYLWHYKIAFGQAKMSEIIRHRGADSIPIAFLGAPCLKNIVNAFVSRPLFKLVVGDLSLLLFHASPVRTSRSPLRYDSVLAAFEEAIQALEIQANVA